MLQHLHYCIIKLIILCILPISSFANTWHFTTNKAQVTLYQSISALKLPEATSLLQQEISKDPTNLSSIYLANYIDFYELFFNEDASLFAKQKPLQAKRIDLLNKLPNASEHKQYAKGVHYFQWALVKLKFKEYFGAAQDMRTCYLLMKENKKKFPNYSPPDAYIGAIETVIGTIPPTYKWVATILGLSGNVNTGIAKVQAAQLQPNKPYAMDVLFLYTYIQQYFGKQQSLVWQTINGFRNEASSNRLLTFLIANIAINQNKAEDALQVVNANNTKAGFMQMPILNMEKGIALLYKQDKECVTYLNKFLDQTKGNFYKKDACYKICMYYASQNNMALAEKYRLRIATIGNTEADADKSAQAFYKNRDYSSPELLQARFLFDGGYYQKCQETLDKIRQKPNKTELENLEYSYRQGRLYQEIKNYTQALIFYNATLQIGENKAAYYAARAALESGNIKEEQKDAAEAGRYFKKCLAMRNHQYQSSIDQQAKAGLQRLGN